MSDEPTTIIAGSASTSAPAIRQEIAALFERRHNAYERLDAAQLAADYSPDCIVESPTAGVHEGRAAVQAAFQAWFDAFPDMKVRAEKPIIDGNRVAQVVSVEGTDMGSFFGFAATGKQVHLTIAVFCEIEGRHIRWERRIYDFTGLLVQIGMLKAKPA